MMSVNAFFWGVTTRGLVDRSHRFGEICCQSIRRHIPKYSNELFHKIGKFQICQKEPCSQTCSFFRTLDSGSFLNPTETEDLRIAKLSLHRTTKENCG